MWSINGEMCTIKDMNRTNKIQNHCQFGDGPFAATLCWGGGRGGGQISKKKIK